MADWVGKDTCILEIKQIVSGSALLYSVNQDVHTPFGYSYKSLCMQVLRNLFHKSWGEDAERILGEFNDFLENNAISISMELVDPMFGQNALITAVTENIKFYSTPDLLKFCRKWRLPTINVWQFSTRESASSFFAAYETISEEENASSIFQTLDMMADVSAKGYNDQGKVQNSQTKCFTAKIVSFESLKEMEAVLKKYPHPPSNKVSIEKESEEDDIGLPTTREVVHLPDKSFDEEKKTQFTDEQAGLHETKKLGIPHLIRIMKS
uniref:Uncharacterized protein n=1 Tax=Leersia perrieri TaxID=77586 RepID=A0A0D9WXF0_9ORYZ